MGGSRAMNADRRRAASPFFAPKPPRSQILTTPGGHISQVKDLDEPPKSSVAGAAFNLINAIVGAGIIGIPFAINQCSLVLGFIMVNVFAFLTVKSLRLLVETAKHIDVATYERLAEASFGKNGFYFITLAMFIMAYGAMIGYMIIIKTNLSLLLGVEADDVEMSRAVLIISSFFIILPLSLQRDMSNLSKTSTISVIFDCFLVGIVAYTSPVQESISDAGGLSVIIKNSAPDFSTFFTGIGVLCFAFVCQHSAFIIAASLDRPTQARWNSVTGYALSTCAVLASVIGLSGYLGFMDGTDGDILVNLGHASRNSDVVFLQRTTNVARGLLCFTMFFVYPMELFVARHSCVVFLFKGRRAHEGDDHSVLARADRLGVLTVSLYLISLIPAVMFDDLGSVFAVTGSLGGSVLSYIGPGLTYLGVHGSDFLELVSRRWDCLPDETTKSPSTPRRALHPDIEGGLKPLKKFSKTIIQELFDDILWYALLMPLWIKVAVTGRDYIRKHKEDEALKSPMPMALGKVVHHNRNNHRNLMRPMRRSGHGDSDTDEIKPLVRTLSDVNFAGRLPPLVPMRKGKVGFALDATLSPAANEKVALEKIKPITPDSFSGASFEVLRETQTYGSTKTTILQRELRDIKRLSNGSLSINGDSSTSVKSTTDQDEGLTYDDESQGTSIFIDESDDVSSHHSGNSSVHVAANADADINRSIQSARSTQRVVDEVPKFLTVDEVKAHPAVKQRIFERGNLISLAPIRTKDEMEDDPQDSMPSVFDFAIAIFYVVFGVVAASAGLYSSFS